MPIRVKGPTADRHPRREWNSSERRRERQKEYIKKHGKPDKKRIQIKPKVSDRMQKLRDNLASVTGGEWGKKSGGSVGKTKGPKGTGTRGTIRDKKATGGRIGLRHGGSVGAAVRGHGAEIK